MCKMDTEDMIKDILGLKYKTIHLNGLKKYENDAFLILQFQRHSLVVDKRYKLPQIHTSLSSAHSIIKKKISKNEKNK